MFPASEYDPETLRLLHRVFDEAWVAMQTMLIAPPIDANAMRSEMAKRIMVAANEGERDPIRLKLRALKAIEA